MAQYSDPSQFANIFSIYSQVYKTEQEQKEAEKEETFKPEPRAET